MWNWLNKKVKQADEDWADKEIKKFADDLEEKRKKAIEYLGDNWILKGGQYNRSNVSLGKK
jgi:hypothetical protein